MSNSSGITTLTKRLAAIFNFVKKICSALETILGFFTGIKGEHTGSL